MKFEFTATERDQGYATFLSAEAMRADGQFVRDGRLYIDVRCPA